jgi:serine/threonine protein kinase/formylglycine-generating enzyme required for sulfatase activity
MSCWRASGCTLGRADESLSDRLVTARMTTTPGFALLVELPMPATPATHGAMAFLGETLLSSRPALEVHRLAPELPALPGPDCAAVKGHFDTLADHAGDTGVLIVSAGLADTLDGPALVVGPHWREYPRESTVPLAWLGERLETARASSLVVALALAPVRDEPARDPPVPADGATRRDVSWPELMRTLGKTRPDCLLVIHDHSLLDVLAGGLGGAALDLDTGTITMRSLGRHLERRARGAALRLSERPHTILTPPSRLHALSWSELVTALPAGTDEPPALEGRILPGRFRIERELARGGFGVVYHARQLTVNRDVAVKVLHQAVAPGSDEGRMFLREIQAVGRLDHPHIVRIYQADITPDGRLFYAMELVRGRDLQSLLDAGERFDRERAVAVSCQILSALGAAHAAGVIHADIKPANVMLVPSDAASGRDERPILLDFGLARLKPGAATNDAAGRAAAPATEDDRSLGGTPAFMAPEQIHRGRVDARSDIFAVGLVLVQMLTGWRRQRWADLVPPLDDVEDEHLRAVLGRALAVEPSERFDSARAFVDALQRRPTSPSESQPHAPPFHHLAPLGEGDVLHGRDRAVASLTAQVLFRPAVIYTAPSGTGKSSLLCAGLVPHLRELGAHVVYVACRPGATRAVIDALSGHARGSRPQPASAAPEAPPVPPTPDDLAHALRLALAHALEQLHADGAQGRNARRLVLILDQVEALFLDPVTPAERHALLDTLFDRTRGPDTGPFSLVLAIREDFLARLLDPAHAAVPILRLGPLGRDEARAALTGPLALARIQIEEALLERLLDDLAAAGAELAGPLGWTLAPEQSAIYPPHLQLIGSVLYDSLAEDEPTLTMSHYQRIGGLDTVLAEHLDRVLDREIDPEDRSAARALFLELVSSAQTRVARAEVDLLAALEIVHPAERVRRALEVLRVRGLLVPVSLHQGAHGWELVHDSLIPRVLAWADRHDLGRRQAQEMLHHHLRRSTHKQPSLLARAELRELARHPDAMTTLERELSARWQGETLAPWAPWTPRSLVTHSHRAWQRRTATLASFALLAVAVSTTTTWRWYEESALREDERRQRQEEQQREQSLRDRDLGRFELVLEPFDWDAERGEPRMVDAAELPDLDWVLHEPDVADPGQPGQPVASDRVLRQHAPRILDRARHEHIEARSGPAFLELTGRGRAGARCLPAWIPLRRLPGYAERERETPVLRVLVPTCQASMAGMREIPAGPFIKDGPGDPPSRFPEYVQDERTVDLTTFWIDATEVTNAAYAHYAAMAAITGRAMPAYPEPGSGSGSMFRHAAEPRHPVAGIDWYEARDYCRFLGKELPTSEQWEKAARGGLYLDATNTVLNPHPHRNLPWFSPPATAGRANVENGHGTIPVGSLLAGASPYGIFDMAGNVWEWTRDTSRDYRAHTKTARGGGWSAPLARELHTIAYENSFDARDFAWDIGVRCVMDGP